MTSVRYLNGLYQQNRKLREKENFQPYKYIRSTRTNRMLIEVFSLPDPPAFICRQNLTSLTLKNKLKRIRSFL